MLRRRRRRRVVVSATAVPAAASVSPAGVQSPAALEHLVLHLHGCISFHASDARAMFPSPSDKSARSTSYSDCTGPGGVGGWSLMASWPCRWRSMIGQGERSFLDCTWHRGIERVGARKTPDKGVAAVNAVVVADVDLVCLIARRPS
ncbi:hypothetical protein HDK64DRAFT_271635 [Phyllosticta capitalensis]